MLPLDGGWVVQAILASRHVLFEVAFRVLAVAGLFTIGVHGGDKPLLFLAVVMLVGLPAAYKLARITRDLRRSGLEPASPDDQTIPVTTSEAIIAKVAEAFPRVPSKQTAQYTLHIFESLNARPPGLVASVALGAAQGASLLAAVVFAVLIVVGQQADLGTLMRSARALPLNRLEAETIVIRSPPGLPGVTEAPHNTLVATFEGLAKAQEAALDLERRAPSRPVVVFGQTVLLALPVEDDAGRKEWLAVLQGEGADVFVATPEAPANVQLTCLASSVGAATAIEQEAGDYFLGADLQLLPPWAEPDPRTPTEQAGHARARRTYARLVQAAPEALENPRMKELAGKLAAAQRSGDAVEARSLRGERDRLLAELRDARIAGVRAEEGADPVVVDRYRALFADPAQRRERERMSSAIGPLLGQMELVGGTPDPKTSAFSALGFLGRQGLLLSMPLLRFGSTFAGPPAMVRWLRSKGCIDFRYQLTAGYVSDDDGDEEAE